MHSVAAGIDIDQRWLRALAERFFGRLSSGFLRNVVLRNTFGRHRIISGRNRGVKLPIIAMLRVRNESLLITDTLDHLASFADGIVMYDDASMDDTVAKALSHHALLEIIVNGEWRTSSRIWEETANRRKLYRRTLRYTPEWVVYCDADERLEGDIREHLLHSCPGEVEGIRVRLLDAYMTEDDKEPFRPGDRLWNFRKSFGRERRDILMAWRANRRTDFIAPDSREPLLASSRVETRFWCQHYGKALSVEQWEDTCRYYIDNFPDNYRQRWLARLGKAVHAESDFGTPLYPWEIAKMMSVKIN